MQNSPLRSNLDRRRYRMAQAATVAGSLAVGSLVVSRLVAFFRDDFFLFYGVSDVQYRLLEQNTIGQVPLTVGKLFAAAIALVAVCQFIWQERRRVRQTCDLKFACRRKRSELVVERLSAWTMFDQLVTRTSVFAAVLLMIWLLQSCLHRWLGGLGWGLEYADWRSLLPLASVFGVCVLAGMLVAAVSLVGLRAIHVLELVLLRIGRMRHARARRVARASMLDRLFTVRELIGCDIQSRPPPVAA